MTFELLKSKHAGMPPATVSVHSREGKGIQVAITFDQTIADHLGVKAGDRVRCAVGIGVDAGRYAIATSDTGNKIKTHYTRFILRMAATGHKLAPRAVLRYELAKFDKKNPLVILEPEDVS